LDVAVQNWAEAGKDAVEVGHCDGSGRGFEQSSAILFCIRA
jgi:hypothetical protein